MKTLSWGDLDPDTGEPYTWGHPNLRWGSPAYVLEYGDYGYTPTGPHLITQPKKHTMPRQRYYPIRIGDQILWLENFRLKINTYATALEITPEEVLEIIADCRWEIYILGTWQPAAKAWGESVTNAVKQSQYGTGGTLVLPPFVAPPLPPAEPSATPPLPAVVPRPEGVLTRLFDLIAEIKENDACTDAMCTDLGITGSTESGPDLETLRPEITATRSGNTVKIGWGWQGYAKFLDACEIVVDRATGTWVPLVTDTTPNYTDPAPQPATHAIWKYKAIYRIDDQQAGQWSMEVSVLVGG